MSVTEEFLLDGGEALPKLDLHDSMEVVVARHGFMPVTKDELREVVGIDAFDVRQGGVARHLNEVLLHGKKPHVATEDPTQGVRSITQEYVWFATQAHEDTRQLYDFYARFEEMLNPHVSIYDYLLDNVGPSKIVNEPGAAQLIPYMDLKQFTETGNEAPHGFEVLKKHSRERGDNGERRILDVYHMAQGSPDMAAHVIQTLQKTSAGDLRGPQGSVVEAAIDDAINRFEYWLGVLQQSRHHLVARAIAQRAVDYLTNTTDL